MRRNVGAACLAMLLAGCGQAAASPVPSMPPVPVAPAGWTALASIGGTGDPGFSGMTTEVSGRPLAIHVACSGVGTLVVMIGRGPDAGGLPATGEDAVTFPCSIDAGTASERHELETVLGAGSLTVDGAVIEGAGALRPLPLPDLARGGRAVGVCGSPDGGYSADETSSTMPEWFVSRCRRRQ